MSFLENFKFSFQDISLVYKQVSEGKYGENIHTGETTINLSGSIQKKKEVGEGYMGKANNISFNSKDYVMRIPLNYSIKKGNTVRSMGNEYKVIHTEEIIISGKPDHIYSIIRLIE